MTVRRKVCGWMWSAALLVAAPSLLLAATEGATLEASTLRATGQQSARLHVTTSGYFAIRARSAQGVALRLIDRMAGAEPWQGEPGVRDGRIDALLEAGEYKIVSRASEQGAGQVELSVHDYREQNAAPPMLAETQLLSTTLGDLQQRSYRLIVANRRSVFLEAAGRSLQDLRVWRDGAWLVDAALQNSQVAPRIGQPLRMLQLSTVLEPGNYIVTVYGGAPLPWAEQSDAQPLLLRVGIPSLPATYQQQNRVSEFGFDRYIVDGEANFFQLKLPVAAEAELSVSSYDAAMPLAPAQRVARIATKQIPPRTEIVADELRNTRKQVVVSGSAGQAYRLQHFDKRWRYDLRPGRYWLGAVQDDDALADSADATALLLRLPDASRRPPEVLAAQALTLTSHSTWRRSFNVLDRTTVFVEVKQTGRYRLAEVSGNAQFRLQPFFVLLGAPPQYQPPPWRRDHHEFDLDAGFYVLELEPLNKGIVDLVIGNSGAASVPMASPLPAPQFGAVDIARANDRYALITNERPDVSAGLVVRSLPLALAEAPFSFTQSAQRGESFPVMTVAEGAITALDDDGQSVPFQVADRANGAGLPAGRYRLDFPPLKDGQRRVTIAFQARRRESLPGVPAGEFAALHAGEPQYFDLPRRGQATYQVHVREPALYRLETTGLLSTAGNVRTRLRPRLFHEASNGVGRNFLVQQFLRPGDYFLTLSAQGDSSGHLGLRLQPTPLTDAGELSFAVPARAELTAATALQYRVAVAAAGRYRIESYGVQRDLRLRIEDSEGWPVDAAYAQSPVEVDLQPGEYRVLVLPEAATVRALTQIARVETAPPRRGPGPHRLALGETVQHTFERLPSQAVGTDHWTFQLPAQADVTIRLSAPMTARLRAQSAEQDIASLVVDRPWTQRLAAGTYTLAVQPLQQDNFVSYTVAVETAQLLDGSQRVVAAPADLAIGVGREGLVELYSLGRSDVRARLYDSNNGLIASNDDRPGDWNFFLARPLAAGEYRLRVEPVHESAAVSTVVMRMPVQRSEATLTAEQAISWRDDDVHVLTFRATQNHELAIIQAKSTQSVGLTIDVKQGERWHNLGNAVGVDAWLALPLSGQQDEYRLRAWSVDQRHAPITLSARSLSLSTISVATDQLRLPRLFAQADSAAAADEGFFAQLLDVDSPGLLRGEGLADLYWSDSPLAAMQAVSAQQIPARGRRLWLLRRATASTAAQPVRAERAVLSPSQPYLSHVALPNGAPLRIPLLRESATPVLVVARSPGSLIGLSEGGGFRFTAFDLAVDSTALLTFKSTALGLWNASAPGGGAQLHLQAFYLQPVSADALRDGINDIHVAGQAGLRAALPPGNKVLRMSLPPDTAAALVRGEDLASLHWAGAAELNEAIETDASEILLVNTGADMRSASVVAQSVSRDVSDIPQPPAALHRAQLRESQWLRWSLEGPVAPSRVRHWRWRGQGQAYWIDSAGNIQRGHEATLPGAGLLRVRADRGWHIAWPDDLSWPAAVEYDVGGAQRFTVSGDYASLQLAATTPRLVELRSHRPVLVRWRVPNGDAEVEFYGEGLRGYRFLPAGATHVGLLPVAQGRLEDTVDSLSVTPLTLREGSGPAVLLGSGQSAFYSFELAQAGLVGVGVRASRDVVESRLYTAEGAVIGSGVVQLVALQPGRYFWAVGAPQDGGAVTVQPVVVGLTPPPPAPPAAIVEAFLGANAQSVPLLYRPESRTLPMVESGAEGEAQGAQQPE